MFIKEIIKSIKRKRSEILCNFFSQTNRTFSQTESSVIASSHNISLPNSGIFEQSGSITQLINSMFTLKTQAQIERFLQLKSQDQTLPLSVSTHSDDSDSKETVKHAEQVFQSTNWTEIDEFKFQMIKKCLKTLEEKKQQETNQSCLKKLVDDVFTPFGLRNDPKFKGYLEGVSFHQGKMTFDWEKDIHLPEFKIEERIY